MITVLTEALPYGTDPSLSSVEETENETAMAEDRRAVRDRLFGVIVSGTDFSTNDLNYEVFIAPSTMEEGKSYRYYAPVFEAEERVILPLVNFGGVVNNGGNFVKYQDDTYYWKLADGSVEEGAMYALFAVDENVIQQLVRRNGSGQETVVLEDTCHDTEIYICGDTLYYKPKYNQWTAFDLSENQKKNSYESMYVVGVDEERGLLLCEITGTGMVALNSEGDMSVIETTSFNYLGSLNGKYYYTVHKDDYNAVEFFSYDIEKQQKESIGSISKDELGIENLDNIYVEEVHFNDGYLYATVGGVMETAMFFVGGVYRSDLKGEMIKIIPSVDFDKIYIEENQDGDDILYYTNSGAGYSATGGGFLFADQGVQAFNLETGEVSQTDFVISSIGDAIVMNGGIYSLLDTGGQYTEIVSHELAERMGYADMGQEQGDSLVIARELDIVDDMAYVSICRVYEDSAYSLGWRPGYRRDIIETFAVEIGTNKAVKLDSY